MCASKKILWCLFLSSSLIAVPADMYHDPVVFHDIEGANPYPSLKDKTFDINIVPYYRSAHGAKNENGDKVQEGDRLGRWNMIGLLHGTAAAPGGSLAGGSTPILNAASVALSTNRDQDYTDNNFTDSSELFGHYTVPIKYEKGGLRLKVLARLWGGFGIVARSGFASYRQAPVFTDLTSTASENNVGFVVNNSVTFAEDKVLTQTHLMIESQRDAISSEISMSLDRYTDTDLEDTHLALFWNHRFNLKDENNKHVVSVIPHAEVGVWLPTGSKKDQDIAFSLSTGNDDFVGATFEGGLNFDFPGQVQLGFGGALSYFESETRSNYRVPSSETQSGLYPWKTTVRKRPGISWNLHAGFSAEDFLDHFSAYFTYIYARHEEDSITVIDNPTFFVPNKLERESSWAKQVFHMGLRYRIVPNMLLGFGVQAPITGKRVYKATSVFGDIKFAF